MERWNSCSGIFLLVRHRLSLLLLWLIFSQRFICRTISFAFVGKVKVLVVRMPVENEPSDQTLQFSFTVVIWMKPVSKLKLLSNVTTTNLILILFQLGVLLAVFHEFLGFHSGQ